LIKILLYAIVPCFKGGFVNNLSLKEEACKKAFYFKENSQEENLD
jgi:hypothetical protein